MAILICNMYTLVEHCWVPLTLYLTNILFFQIHSENTDLNMAEAAQSRVQTAIKVITKNTFSQFVFLE